MGKIRIKELGDEQEEQQKKETKKKREAKKAVEKKTEVVEVEQPVILVSEAHPEPKEKKDAGQASMTKAKTKKEKFKKTKQSRSRKYQEAKIKTDPTKKYALQDALELLTQVHIADFDETVELHINTETTGITGAVMLPHGTGKKLRVAIATDALIVQIEKKGVDFDILLAQPAFMPKLAKVAKVLGPRGLMPNPKNGTITQNPEETAKKYEGGHTNYKTEAKVPVIHMTVGKMSFGSAKLAENITTVFDALKNAKVKQVVLKSTMSPGIKVEYTSL